MDLQSDRQQDDLYGGIAFAGIWSMLTARHCIVWYNFTMHRPVMLVRTAQIELRSQVPFMGTANSLWRTTECMSADVVRDEFNQTMALIGLECGNSVGFFPPNSFIRDTIRNLQHMHYKSKSRILGSYSISDLIFNRNGCCKQTTVRKLQQQCFVLNSTRFLEIETYPLQLFKSLLCHCAVTTMLPRFILPSLTSDPCW